MLERRTKHRSQMTLKFEVMPNVFIEVYSVEFGEGAPHEQPLYELLETLDLAGRLWEREQRLRWALKAAGQSDDTIDAIAKGEIRP